MAITEKEKLVLGFAGGLVTIIIGYLVWRHEHNIQLQDAQDQQATADANNAAYAQQLEDALQTQYPVFGSGYTSPAQASTDTGSNIESADTNTALEAILQAFFPQGTAGSSSGSSSGSGASSGNSVGSPTHTPIAPGIPVTGGPSLPRAIAVASPSNPSAVQPPTLATRVSGGPARIVAINNY